MKRLIIISIFYTLLFSQNLTSLTDRLLENFPSKKEGIKSISITSYQYIDDEELKEMKDFFGSDYNPPEIYSNVYEEYDMKGNLINLKTTNFEFNISMNRIYKYDYQNRLVEVDYDPSLLGVSKDKYSYTKKDSIYTEIHLGDNSNIISKVTYIYDLDDNYKVKSTHQDLLENELYIEKTYFYNDKNQLIEVLNKDESGSYKEDLWGMFKTSYIYDTIGNVVEVTSFNLKNEIIEKESRIYDSYNNIIVKKLYFGEETPLEIYNKYDLNNNLIEITKVDVIPEQKTKFTYNVDNDLIEELIFKIDKKTRKETLVKKNWFTYEYY